MYSVAQRRANCTALSHVMLGFITAPLITLSMSMQVSMPQYRVTMESMLPEAKRDVKTSQMRFSAASINPKADLKSVAISN